MNRETYGCSITMCVVGVFLTITGIGSVIGIPMIILAGLGVVLAHIQGEKK